MVIIKLAYCGDRCDLCPRYIATKKNDIEELKNVAVLMQKVGWTYNLEDPLKMICHGCEDVESCEYQVKECCIERKIINCGKCNEYPCPKIQNAFDIASKNTEKFKNILTTVEYDSFLKAFFEKKINLDYEKRKE